jgi:hypothetical protein
MSNFVIVSKRICPHLHTMNDFGHAPLMECDLKARTCPYNGKCLTVGIEKGKKERS